MHKLRAGCREQVQSRSLSGGADPGYQGQTFPGLVNLPSKSYVPFMPIDGASRLNQE
ncbi:MAG: hypothetical protein GIW99_08045 [Candidatus Eremiobacteraeota bacterium]|nr:hypothetical protein [Candidatus Eremiobacteraeota bacterium]